MKVVSFFAGCGGLDLGFEQAGFHVVWANELESHCRATYIRNHPNTMFVLGDICKIDSNSIPDCDGFIGGPPCQSWSVAGKQKGLEDERGKLFCKYIEIINLKKPKFFLIENVKGLCEGIFSHVFIMFLEELKKAGYDVKWELLDAVNFGVPQNRERVFIIGFRKDLNVNYEFPKATCSEPVPMIKAIGDIREAPTLYNGKDKVVPNTTRANHDVLTSGFNQFYYRGYRRRAWRQPSFTIHATADNIPLHPSSPKMMFFGHEKWDFQKDKMDEYRRLSVRECARIQTFPDNFYFVTDDIKAAYKMIGNAVPPRLGKALASSIYSLLHNIKFEQPATQIKSPLDESVLVGYFKNAHHHDLIIKNRLYYVRSDGRSGSIFKDDCEMMPKFLLLHHKETAEIYELDAEVPVLSDVSLLKTLGFDCSGQTYLCFRLKNDKRINFSEFGVNRSDIHYVRKNFAPYFTTLNELMK